ncbi:glycerol kinase GlpK [Litorivicinus lipolyticus]|uniref:glycerol kinase GlpK n=1 Tax=Litorivicinus lipolyticus TaxID=418701 RepID=UPI003B5BF219
MTYVLALDAGTTSNRAIVFDSSGAPLSSASVVLPQHFPHDGWVEHHGGDIIDGLVDSARAAIAEAGIEPGQIAAVGLTNQRETTLVWDRSTSEPVYPAIVWQDRRTAAYCADLKAAGLEPEFAAKTGLLLDPYFSGTKIRWILDHIDDGQGRAERGELAFGTVDTWVAWVLSGGQRHIMDASNAARTLLFDIDRQCWDASLMGHLNIPAAMLPSVLDSAGDLAPIQAEFFGAPLRLTGIAGDQHAALIGQACIEPGMVKSTYGTGCFMMVNTGHRRLPSKHRLLSTLAYRLNGVCTYALEGAIFNVGTSIQWLRDGLAVLDDAAQSQAMAEQARDDEVFLVPAFTGLGAPWWDANARGLICGLTRDTGRNEIVRAALDACAYQTADLLQAMDADGQPCAALRVDGGMVVNDWLCQRLADLCGVRIDRPEVTETTALGAALLAAIGAGLYPDLAQATAQWSLQRSFQSTLDAPTRGLRHRAWQGAVKRALSE